MKKQLLVAGAFAVFSLASTAQITDVGGPISLKGKSATVVDVPREIMPGFDMATVQAQDIVNDAAKDSPWRFGYKYETNLNPKTNGVWTEIAFGEWKSNVQGHLR